MVSHELLEFREGALAMGLSTNRADRSRFEQIVTDIYHVADFQQPVFIWFGSFTEAVAGHLLLMNFLANERSGLSDSAPLFFVSEVVKALAGCSSLADGLLLGEMYRELFGAGFNPAEIQQSIVTGAVAHIQSQDKRAIQGMLVRAWESIGECLKVDPEIRTQSVQVLPEMMASMLTLWRQDYRTRNPSFYSPLDAIQRLAPSRIGLIEGVDSVAPDWIVKLMTPERLVKRPELLDLMWAAAETGAWWFPFENVCCAWDGPLELHTDDRFRLHHDTDVAVRFSEGCGLHYMRGFHVPESMVKGTFFIPDIDNERNVELRRIMIEKYGLADYIEDSEAEILASDDYGVLYIKYQSSLLDEPVVAVKVTNKTADADGKYREYFLRVPPHIRTAREAVAWTFGFEAEEYQPVIET